MWLIESILLHGTWMSSEICKYFYVNEVRMSVKSMLVMPKEIRLKLNAVVSWFGIINGANMFVTPASTRQNGCVN